VLQIVDKKLGDIVLVGGHFIFHVISAVVNPLEPSVIMWLHFKCSAPYRHILTLLISDI